MSILIAFFSVLLLYAAYLIVASVIYENRHPNANYLDTPLGKFWNNTAKGIEKQAVEDMKKKDPEWKKKYEKGDDAVRKMHEMFEKNGLKRY
tara:strand:- start:87 stop:362 length:276 start_codon:yes stop_codon:yes gene_type:complete